jgi:hypothetical protein
VISLFIFLGVAILLLVFKKIIEVFEQSNYERRRFHLMVAEELKRLDEIYKDKQSWGEVQYEEKKWWGRN